MRRSLFVWIALGLTGCGRDLPLTLRSPVQSQVDQGRFIEGVIRLPDDSSEDLASLADRPLVIMMAGEFCSTCIHESAVFKKALDTDVLENRIRFRSVLVGNNGSGAREWKYTHQIPWPVSYQENDSLFNEWCPERMTPCLLVQTPDRGVVLRRAGLTQVSDIEVFTGSWRYEQ